jgi:hypothetical protein
MLFVSQSIDAANYRTLRLVEINRIVPDLLGIASSVDGHWQSPFLGWLQNWGNDDLTGRDWPITVSM